MTPGEAILIQLAEAQKMLGLVMAGMTPAMLTWRPPGTALPIGVIYAHAVGVEDLYIQQIIQGRPLLWERDGWATRLGDPAAPNTWNLNATLPPDMTALAEYRQAVFESSQAYVHGLGGDELDRAVGFPGSAWSMSVAQLLAVVIAHTTGHAGEIAMLKGIQGGQGLPY